MERERKHDEYDVIIKKIFADLYCNKLGIIASFDAIKQTANIYIVDLEYKNNEVFDKRMLPNVPLMINATQDGGLTLPIKEGDLCVIHFDDRDKDDYLLTGEIRKPATTRKHDVNDCYFTILAPRPRNKTLPEYLTDAVKLYYKTTFLKLENNKASLKTSQANITIDDDKIDIANNITDLKTALQAIIDAVKPALSVDLTKLAEAEASLNSLLK